MALPVPNMDDCCKKERCLVGPNKCQVYSTCDPCEGIDGYFSPSTCDCVKSPRTRYLGVESTFSSPDPDPLHSSTNRKGVVVPADYIVGVDQVYEFRTVVGDGGAADSAIWTRFDGNLNTPTSFRLIDSELGATYGVGRGNAGMQSTQGIFTAFNVAVPKGALDASVVSANWDSVFNEGSLNLVPQQARNDFPLDGTLPFTVDQVVYFETQAEMDAWVAEGP